MFHVTFATLAAAALLLPRAVIGQIIDSFERDELEREFESLAYGDQQVHHHFRHRHFRHHHPHLRHHKRAFLLASAPASTIPATPSSQDILPGRHAAVAQKLGHMDMEIRDLAGRKQVADTARTNLVNNVKQAVSHMNEAVEIRREVARTEARLDAEELKLKRLEDDRLRLDRSHGHLISSLHHIMEPKIRFAESRLDQSQERLHKLESNAAAWKSKETKFHDSSLTMLEKRRETNKRLQAADEAEKKARAEQEVAKKQLEAAKHSVVFNVEGYKYAQTRARASASELARGKEILVNAEASVKRLNGILNMEQKRVDESMAVGKDRVEGRIRELETLKEKSKSKLSKLNQEYKAWQEQQRLYARQVVADKQVTHQNDDDYAVHQQSVLNSAQAKVAYEAESDSDWAWDEWPAAGKQDVDEVQLTAI